jgi:ketosteroid isomerase-like protein
MSADCCVGAALLNRLTGLGDRIGAPEPDRWRPRTEQPDPGRVCRKLQAKGGQRKLEWQAREMHTTIIPVLIASTLLGPIAGHAQTTIAPVQQPQEQRVLATEDEYVAAEVNRDEPTLRRLVDDRFVYNSSKGTTSGKEELVKNVLEMTMTRQTLTERSVLMEGDVAFIFGTTELRFAVPGKEDAVSTLRYTSTWVKRQGEWRMLALQMQQRARD